MVEFVCLGICLGRGVPTLDQVDVLGWDVGMVLFGWGHGRCVFERLWWMGVGLVVGWGVIVGLVVLGDEIMVIYDCVCAVYAV